MHWGADQGSEIYCIALQIRAKSEANCRLAGLKCAYFTGFSQYTDDSLSLK